MAYVLSSVSGNLISAASAGFAPTNSADVSAIASAYQVVSATATQLYAGTAYVTSVNDNPLSASRAGNAANASMANSAYYDGTGRLISALPDEAAVSSIASAYAESAASSKQDTLTFGYDTSDKISSINGSALAGGGATGDYVEKSATEVAIGTGNTSVSTALAQGYKNSTRFYSFAQGSHNTVSGVSFAQGSYNSASSESFAQGYRNGATGSSFAQGYLNTASGVSFAQGYHNSAIHTAAVFGQYNLRGNGDTATGNSAAFAIGDGTAYNARHDLMLVTKDGEITMYSSTADTVGTGIISSIRAISAAATGGVNSATVSAIASAYAESAVSSVSGNYALSSDVSATVDLVGTQSANWGGSALALSAGPGVKLEKVGDTLVASTDETVLWNGSGSAFTTTEPLTNFSEIKFHVKSHASANVGEAVVPMVDNNRTAIKLSWADDWNKGAEWLGGLQWWASLSNTGMTSFVVSNSYYIGLRSGVTFGGGSYGTNIYVLDVIGVGRTAGV